MPYSSNLLYKMRGINKIKSGAVGKRYGKFKLSFYLVQIFPHSTIERIFQSHDRWKKLVSQTKHCSEHFICSSLLNGIQSWKHWHFWRNHESVNIVANQLAAPRRKSQRVGHLFKVQMWVFVYVNLTTIFIHSSIFISVLWWSTWNWIRCCSWAFWTKQHHAWEHSDTKFAPFTIRCWFFWTSKAE